MRIYVLSEVDKKSSTRDSNSITKTNRSSKLRKKSKKVKWRNFLGSQTGQKLAK